MFFSVFGGKNRTMNRTEKAMASANAVDMDAGAMASGEKAARKPKPATNGLGSDEVDGLQKISVSSGPGRGVNKKDSFVCFFMET